MPLFDLFKKSPKKEEPKKSSFEEVFGSQELQKRRYDAAVEFLGVLQESFLSSQGEGHAGTVLASTAWLTGTSLYRALNAKDNMPPGTVVLSEKVNEEGPTLINMLMYYLHQSGVTLKPDQLILDVPAAHKPQKDLAQIQSEFQDQYNRIMKKHRLDYLDGAKAGVIACSIVLQYHCVKQKDMDLRLGAGIISVGIMTGAKTSPVYLNPESASPKANDHPQAGKNAEILVSISRSSISGSGNRLVLGEMDSAVQNALDQGGKFILVHPEVSKLLEQKGFDVYLVYEAAMQAEISSKIPQIDFVGGDVEASVAKWCDKAPKQAPIHVRLMLWLKDNASAFGYAQNGNSWVLKQ